MKRTIKKQFWLNQKEDTELKRKAKSTCLTEAALMRLLLRNYEPRAKPDETFYKCMREFNTVCDSMEEFCNLIYLNGTVNPTLIEDELKRMREMQMDIERKFLQPEKSKKKWQ
ncbi:hypothetical protein M2145_001017 [Lachnospiraceae bacterium PF1-21]|uniref:hypothetical protein n=1 Tax=Ohessyouella blattaphilus TaxID=2949333 RepID=UPI003E25494F